MKRKVDILIPVYYEQDNVAKVVQGIINQVKTSHSITFIYDKIEDPTIEVIKKLKKKYPNIGLLKNVYGKGIISALKTGFDNAKSEIIVVMMADLSDDPGDIDKMVHLIDKGYDLVCASRYTQKGKRDGGSVIKGYLSLLGCRSLNLLTGIPTTDATNAFKCFKKRIIDSIEIESVGGFELPLEITVKAFSHNNKICEIPTVWTERKSGKSKFKLIQWLPQYLKWYFFAFRYRFSI